MLKKLIIFISLILFFITTFSQKKSIDEIVAIVGEKIILKSDVETLRLQYKSRGDIYSGDLECKSFEELLYQSLLVNQAKVDSIEVTENQVLSELERRLAFFEEQMSIPEMEEYFNKPISEIRNYFKDIIEDQLLAQQMESSITADISVRPEEVKKFFKGIPKDSLPLVESEINISQIVIHPKIKDEQIVRIKKSMQAYIDEVNDGKDFGLLASMYSDDEESAKNDGELGWVKRGDLVREFAEAAFELDEEGEISDIVETEYGYHIIQFLERKGERIRIRHILKIPKPLRSEKLKTKAKLDSIADLIRSGTISFEAAAMEYSTDEESNKNGGIVINPYTGTSGFQSSQLDPATNYILKQMNTGEISEPFESYNMKGKQEMKIIKLTEKTEPHIADLKTDYQLISDLAKEKKKDDVISNWIEEKQRTTYFKIDEEFMNCDFKYKGWLSVQ
jgi:peptidyl-prolyl cis-trans isomerase SurA